VEGSDPAVGEGVGALGSVALGVPQPVRTHRPHPIRHPSQIQRLRSIVVKEGSKPVGSEPFVGSIR
jgi:hypothetical protein